jgi:hypothetical protein
MRTDRRTDRHGDANSHSFATAPKNYTCFVFFESVEFHCNVSNIKIRYVGYSFDISYDAHIAFPVVFLSLSTKQ